VKGPKGIHRLYTERSAKNLWNLKAPTGAKKVL